MTHKEIAETYNLVNSQGNITDVNKVLEIEAQLKADAQEPIVTKETIADFKTEMHGKGYHGNEPAYFAEAIKRGIKNLDDITKPNFKNKVKKLL